MKGFYSDHKTVKTQAPLTGSLTRKKASIIKKQLSVAELSVAGLSVAGLSEAEMSVAEISVAQRARRTLRVDMTENGAKTDTNA